MCVCACAYLCISVYSILRILNLIQSLLYASVCARVCVCARAFARLTMDLPSYACLRWVRAGEIYCSAAVIVYDSSAHSRLSHAFVCAGAFCTHSAQVILSTPQGSLWLVCEWGRLMNLSQCHGAVNQISQAVEKKKK